MKNKRGHPLNNPSLGIRKTRSLSLHEHEWELLAEWGNANRSLGASRLVAFGQDYNYQPPVTGEKNVYNTK